MDLLSPGAEVFFTRLIMRADDYGAFHAHPKLILSALFPLKDYTIEMIEGWLLECIESDLIIKYKVDGKSYIQIENFGQRLQNMKKAFPRPENNSPEVTVSHGESREIPARNETKRSRNETNVTQDYFGTNREAHTFLTTNHQDLTAAKKVLTNLGWPSIRDNDVSALAYHFVEKNLDILSKPRDEVRKHFQNWLNKVPLQDLMKLSVKIIANEERKQRQSTEVR